MLTPFVRNQRKYLLQHSKALYVTYVMDEVLTSNAVLQCVSPLCEALLLCPEDSEGSQSGVASPRYAAGRWAA